MRLILSVTFATLLLGLTSVARAHEVPCETLLKAILLSPFFCLFESSGEDKRMGIGAGRLLHNALRLEELDGVLHRQIKIRIAVPFAEKRAVEEAVVFAFEGHEHTRIASFLHQLGETPSILERNRFVGGAVEDDRWQDAFAHMVAGGEIGLLFGLELLRAIALCRRVEHRIEKYHRIGHGADGGLLASFFMAFDHTGACCHMASCRAARRHDAIRIDAQFRRVLANPANR